MVVPVTISHEALLLVRIYRLRVGVEIFNWYLEVIISILLLQRQTVNNPGC